MCWSSPHKHFNKLHVKKNERKSYCFSPLVEELHTDMKETYAEKEDRAQGKAVKMFNASHEDK